MSGTNRLIQSENAMKKASISSLNSALDNANENAKKLDISKKKKEEKKK